MLKLNYFKEFQTLAEFLAQLYPKEAEIFRSNQAARYAHAAWFENASASTPVADKDQLTGSSGLNAKGC